MSFSRGAGGGLCLRRSFRPGFLCPGFERVLCPGFERVQGTNLRLQGLSSQADVLCERLLQFFQYAFCFSIRLSGFRLRTELLDLNVSVTRHSFVRYPTMWPT
jgi:hypothetical protein